MRLLYAAIAVVVIGLAAALSIWATLRGSLPELTGEIAAQDLDAPARIERDAEGVPTIRARSRRDLALATGFAHAQDRYFHMDLMRRSAAGELAELFGAALVDTDKKLRVHGFRRIAETIVRQSSEPERELLEAYAAGVNAGLARNRVRPWEYLLLRSEPRTWRAEDSMLVAFSMYLNLNDSTGEEELARARLRSVLPREMFAFMHPFGTEWDAPVVGGVWRAPPIPGPEVLDLRTGEARTAAITAPRSLAALEEKPFAGSNSWAVAGAYTRDGAALLANDMHLGLRLPHVWYRARLIVESEGDAARDLVGVTLPGLPLLIMGSNRRVAWGYTNSYGDWTDLVAVELDPADAGRYLTPDGSEAFTSRRERIAVRGADAVPLEIRETRWGPIVDKDEQERPLALAWTAHYPRATNIHMLNFEAVRSIEEALGAANGVGAPVQNFVAADAEGRIGWTLMGQIPVRANYDSTAPASWRAPNTGWIGWRSPEQYPRVVDPPSGRLWSANARMVDARTSVDFLGDGGFDLGARAAQIRDGLLSLSQASAEDMLAIQLDDRALFLARWRDLLLELLDERALANQPLRALARKRIERWSGRADANDVGYRIVRAVRLQIRSDVFETLTAAARVQHPGIRFTPSAQFEAPLWRLVTERPAHLLDPHHQSWTQALLASVDAALKDLMTSCAELEQCTWGKQNMLAMRHPLSAVLPFASYWLDMPPEPLSGDAAMPRVQGVAFGASERLVVSPGKEEEQGYIQMPGGPVDHPLSPFYGAGHSAWVEGKPAPLLPGDAQYILRLTPVH
ncbi:MAG TPA: penicillin acylase family protein [Steroidobacter sp.]|nr:penicillin acylase family protein [Steroidobacter sp.]